MSTPDPYITHDFATAAQRRGFANPTQAAELARRDWGLLTRPDGSTADERLRKLAAQRPDLLRPDWASNWSPSELAEVRDSMLPQMRNDMKVREQYAAFCHQHKEALCVADQVREQKRQRVEAKRQDLSGARFAAQQEVARVRERCRAVELQINALAKDAGPYPDHIQKEALQKRVEVLEAVRAEEEGLNKSIASVTQELAALDQE